MASALVAFSVGLELQSCDYDIGPNLKPRVDQGIKPQALVLYKLAAAHSHGVSRTVELESWESSINVSDRIHHLFAAAMNANTS